jgi:glycosyltransferase involved in cell wall biosynthesis
MLKILVISHYFWPESFRMNQVVEDLVAAGAEVTVLAGHPNYPDGRAYMGYVPWRTALERHPAGYDIVRVPVVTRGGASAVRLALNYLSFAVAGVILGPWLLRGRRFDVQFVYCTTPAIQGYIALWLKRLKRVPVVLWVQDIWPEALSATGYVRSPLLLSAVGTVVSAMYRRSDLILGQSRSFVRMIRQRASGAAVEHFPNPGEHEPADGEPAPTLPDGFNVVFGGNIGRAQAMETVLAAAELLSDDPDVRFVLFGSGSMVGWLEETARARGLTNLVLAGRLPPAAMPAVYRQASALLLPLTDDPAVAQTVPSKLQSYFGAGRPVIAAVNGEAAEIVIEAGAGLVCSAEDPAALAATVRELRARSEMEREQMGHAARRFFEAHYDPTKLALNLLHRLKQVARQAGVERSRHV